MPEKSKLEKDIEKRDGVIETENACDNETDENDKSVWSRDQRKKSYYYDDAHGYEIYNPVDEEDDS